MHVVPLLRFKITTCTSPYDFSTNYGDFYKTAYHFKHQSGPVCDYGLFHPSWRSLKIMIKIMSKLDTFWELPEFTDLVFDFV